MRSASLLRLGLVVLLALAAACQGPAPSLPEAADEVRDAVGDAVGKESPGADGGPNGQQPTGGDGQSSGDASGPSSGSGTEPPPASQEQQPGETAAVPDDHAGVGAMCRHYLRPQVPRLVVEVDAQAGAEPTPSAVEHLMGVLGGVVDKPGGVSVVTGSLPGGERTWTIDELRSFAAQHRSTQSSQQELGMHVLSVRGRLREDVLGVAFSATEVAVFPDAMAGLGSVIGGRAPLERAVLVHEAGHLLCLVNTTYRSEIDREDPEHPHHSRDRSSVMYWAIDTSAVARVFSGPPPDTFTADDRADLRGLAEGRY